MASFDKYGFTPSKEKTDMSALEERIANLERNSFSIKNIFPIGYIFITYSSTNPGTLFPGTTWEKLPAGKMIINYNIGNPDLDQPGKTGGSTSHTHTIQGTSLSVNQMPSHTHSLPNHDHSVIYDQYSQNGLTDEQWNGGTNISGFKDDRRVFSEYTEDPNGAHWRATWRLNGSDNSFGKLNITRVSAAGHPVKTGNPLSSVNVGSTGGNQAHTHNCVSGGVLPPYYVVHMWRRTA